MTKEDEKVLQTLIDKRNSFIGSLKNEITLAEAKGFRQGLDWAIDVINSTNYSENNGWIKIESEGDLKNIEKSYKSYHGAINDFVYESTFNYQTLLEKYKQNELSHYQPVQKPQPRIY